MIQPEISILIPCLNEEKAIGVCIDKLAAVISQHKLNAELIIIDNGSTDSSVAIIKKKFTNLSFGRIVTEPKRGYGLAYQAGIAASLGKYLFFVDADDTYELNEVIPFVQHLKNGADFVIGDRFRGKMEKDVMPFARRYIGNPILSGMLRLLFTTKINDAHCGMRAVKKEALIQMSLQTNGMEFATEMIIQAIRKKLIIVEIPITYRPRIGSSKLHPIRDAFRHITFMGREFIREIPDNLLRVFQE